MSNKVVWGSLAVALVAGLVGMLLSWDNSNQDYPETSFDEASGEPLGI